MKSFKVGKDALFLSRQDTSQNPYYLGIPKTYWFMLAIAASYLLSHAYLAYMR